jgi:hypothetical protein
MLPQSDREPLHDLVHAIRLHAELSFAKARGLNHTFAFEDQRLHAPSIRLPYRCSVSNTET